MKSVKENRTELTDTGRQDGNEAGVERRATAELNAIDFCHLSDLLFMNRLLTERVS
jgi:hypothetical protein